VHQSLISFFLRDLDNVRNPSYSLVAVKMGHGGPTAMAWFGQTSTVARAPSGGALAPRITLVTMVRAATPQSNESVQGAPVKRFNGGGRQWRCGSVWGPNTWGGPPFIGGFNLLVTTVDSDRILA
jgi:hypothetical protein